MLHRLRSLSDPFWSGVLLATGLVISGFVTVGLAWRGAAATLFVPGQVAWLASGGLASLALVGLGAAVVDALLDRRAEATRRARLDEAIDDAVAALVAARGSA